MATEEELAADVQLCETNPDVVNVPAAKRLRFLRARDMDVNKASKMLSKHLEWQADFKPENVTHEQIANSLPSGQCDTFPRNFAGSGAKRWFVSIAGAHPITITLLPVPTLPPHLTLSSTHSPFTNSMTDSLSDSRTHSLPR